MLNVLEILWYKFKPVFLPLFMVGFAFFIGSTSAKHPMYSIAMVGATLYTICLFTKPTWMYFFMLLVCLDFFGFTSPEFMHLPGAFKLRDVCLLSLLVPVCLNIAADKKTLERVKTPFNKYIFLLMLFVLFVVFYTVLEFGVSFITTLRIARKYLFYLSFFIVMYLIKDEKTLKNFFNTLIFMGIFAALLMIAQFMLGTKVIIMPHTMVRYQQLGGFYVPRLYFKGAISLLMMMFSTCFWVYQTATSSKMRKRYFLLTMLFGIAVFLGFSRARWAALAFSVIVPFFFVMRAERKKVLWFIIVGIFGITIASLLIQLLGINIFSFYLKLYERIYSMFFDLINQTGTFGYRMEDSAMRIKYFLDRPLLGVGFLHYLSASESIKAVIVKDLFIETVDSGIMTLLITMGLCGLGMFLLIIFVFVKRCLKTIRMTTHPLLRGIAIGCFGYFAGGVLSFITLGFFTYVYELPYVALTFAFVEKINQLNRKHP